jgi:hypothetical protein
MAESSEPEILIEIAKSAIFFGTGIVFGYHAFGKKNAWWRKKSKNRTYTDDESEFESDEEVLARIFLLERVCHRMSRLIRTVASLIKVRTRLHSISNRFPGFLLTSGGFFPSFLISILVVRCFRSF